MVLVLAGALLVVVGPAPTAAAGLPNSLLLDFGGPGGAFSLNYERFVLPSLSVRGGVGILWVWPSLPMTATWFVGGGTHRLELGAGAVLFFTPDEDDDDVGFLEDLVEDAVLGEGQGTKAVGTATVGYRLTRGRFLLRLAFTPYWWSEDFVPWGGLSVGVAF